MTDQRGVGMTFDSAADLYQQTRPEYPEQLYEAMIAAAALGADDRLLEIGCASGKATLPLARRDFHITCVEPGPALATVARRNLARFPEVEVIQSTFEDVDPSEHEPFDLVFAATAWHWLHPAVRYRRTWELLRPGGHVVLECLTRLSGRRGHLLRRPAAGLRRNRRRPARGGDVPPAGGVARPARGHRGQRALRTGPGAPLRLGSHLRR